MTVSARVRDESAPPKEPGKGDGEEGEGDGLSVLGGGWYLEDIPISVRNRIITHGRVEDSMGWSYSTIMSATTSWPNGARWVSRGR